MGWCSPSSPKRALASLVFFVTGVSLLAAGAHLSYVNIGPQRARTLARDDFVRDFLNKKHGYNLELKSKGPEQQQQQH